MAYFARVGERILNIEAIAYAIRTRSRIEVVFGSRATGEHLSEVFEGVEADRVEALLLKYQETIDASLRRQRVIEAQL